jgi:hypothetical protein
MVTVLTDVCTPEPHDRPAEMQQSAAQTVFTVIDYLNRWLADSRTSVASKDQRLGELRVEACARAHARPRRAADAARAPQHPQARPRGPGGVRCLPLPHVRARTAAP